ncbi:MAG: sulfatase-like hydrolase/transferase [Phycisphaerae bacterium]|nr:sulfatase-like hydrolase/transferase [Phycisphaerae bacterium]
MKKLIGHISYAMTARAYSFLMLAALVFTVAVKLYHALRTNMLAEYPAWILSDVAFVLTVEMIIAFIYCRWPRRTAFRIATLAAALFCTWSIMNAGWVIRTGTQILPSVLLPLFRDPVNTLSIIGINLVKMPLAAVLLLAPSAVLLGYFFWILSHGTCPRYEHKAFMKKTIVAVIIIAVAITGKGIAAILQAEQRINTAMQFNAQLEAIQHMFFNGERKFNDDFTPARHLPYYDEISINAEKTKPLNLVIIVLEGIQFSKTSLAEDNENTPFIQYMAENGISFTQMRSTLTHTTKALFAMLTGKYPSVSQDIAETVPATKPYASLITILKQALGARTAFFQTPKGSFEARPGLVHNLGFDKFWSREDINDPNTFVGYFSADEFTMIEPVFDWIDSGKEPFVTVMMLSVSHDPYEVPTWFAQPAKEPLQKYIQTINYTDSFLAAVDGELEKRGLKKNTVFCIVGDHGEAFGEHGMLGHERICFEETLRIPWIITAPSITAGQKIDTSVSSIDFCPTLLALFGIDVNNPLFDGWNVLDNSGERKVFFSGWNEQSPAGFIAADSKYIYNPTIRKVCFYNLLRDPGELKPVFLTNADDNIKKQIEDWRRASIFHIDQPEKGQMVLFGQWLCEWSNRITSAKYQTDDRQLSE